MKKYIIILIIPLLFFSIGCSDDDDIINDPFSEYSDLILGHWSYISDVKTTNRTYDVDIMEDSVIISPVNYPVIDDSIKSMVYLTFFDDFQMTRSVYQLNSNDQVISFEESILVDYSLEGSVISIPNFFPWNTGDGLINQLTETNLEIQWEWNSVGIQVVYDIDSDGLPISTDVEYSDNIVNVISMSKVSELPQ